MIAVIRRAVGLYLSGSFPGGYTCGADPAPLARTGFVNGSTAIAFSCLGVVRGCDGSLGGTGRWPVLGGSDLDAECAFGLVFAVGGSEVDGDDDDDDAAVDFRVEGDLEDLAADLGGGEAFEEGLGDDAGGLDLVDMAANWCRAVDCGKIGIDMDGKLFEGGDDADVFADICSFSATSKIFSSAASFACLISSSILAVIGPGAASSDDFPVVFNSMGRSWLDFLLVDFMTGTCSSTAHFFFLALFSVLFASSFFATVFFPSTTSASVFFGRPRLRAVSTAIVHSSLLFECQLRVFGMW